MKTKIKVMFFVVSAVCLFTAKVTRAQEENSNYSINPFYNEITLHKDEQSVPFSIEVKNSTQVLAVFRLSVLDFGTLDESGGVAFLGSQDNLKYGLASWVSLENDTLVLKAGESQKVKGVIENKDSLSPGGHYGAVFFKIEDQNGNLQSNNKEVAFDPSFASLLFVRKQGGEITSLSLKEAQTDGSMFSFPTSQKMRFQNSGNVHVTPRGIVQISDPFGKVVAKGIINQQSAIVLPETFRALPVQIEKVAPTFFPGRYKLNLQYRFDGKDDFETITQSFLYIPWQFVLSILFVLLMLILIFKKISKN